MSVNVKGMEMPTQGWKCPLNGVGVCKLKSLSCGKYIPALCPIRPLPEKHGRIVDVGPLEVVAYNLKDHEGKTFDDGVEFILEKLDALPTIVEEEGD